MQNYSFSLQMFQIGLKSIKNKKNDILHQFVKLKHDYAVLVNEKAESDLNTLNANLSKNDILKQLNQLKFDYKHLLKEKDESDKNISKVEKTKNNILIQLNHFKNDYVRFVI